MTVEETIIQPPLPRVEDIKMIVSDVDGTLLDSDHTLPTSSPTYTVIRRIRAAYPDLPIIISTGKQRRSTADLREQLDLHKFPCCHLNGNVVYSASGEIVAESGMRRDMVLEVLAEMRKCGTSVFAYDYDTVHQLFRGLGDDGIWAKKLRGYGELVEDTEPEAYIERIRAGELKIIKMAICQPEETIQRSKKILLSKFPRTAFALTQALDFCIEMIPAGNNKGTALKALLEYMGGDIRPENVITFGDGENDVSMFGVAGMSVAMGNAMECARDGAMWQTASNDDGGVGMFLEKVFWPLERLN